MDYPETPDGRYFVARGRLWRRTDPRLSARERNRAVSALMRARRAVRDAQTRQEKQRARQAVQRAKERLGERGPVWWDDGAPDLNRRAPWRTHYAPWWHALAPSAKAKGLGEQD